MDIEAMEEIANEVAANRIAEISTGHWDINIKSGRINEASATTDAIMRAIRKHYEGAKA
jgi:hypothetical protein